MWRWAAEIPARDVARPGDAQRQRDAQRPPQAKYAFGATISEHPPHSQAELRRRGEGSRWITSESREQDQAAHPRRIATGEREGRDSAKGFAADERRGID